MQRQRLTVMLVCALPILLAGCAQTSTSGGKTICADWRTITWSLQDTPETVDQIKGNNARHQPWCGK